MLYKSIYLKLCKEWIANIACDGQRMSVILDVESRLNRATLLCVPRLFKTLDEAMEHLKNNPYNAQGYCSFAEFEEICLARYNSVSVLEPYEVEALEQHNKVCPLCGREL